MSTAVDFTSVIGQVGFVPQDWAVKPIDPAVPVSIDPSMVGFNTPIDVPSAFDHQATDLVVHAAVDTVPSTYKMNGYSTTLAAYVTWKSFANANTPPPAAYGTVINVTSELLA